MVLFYRPLQYLTFDETSARVAGLPADRLNMWLAVLTALTVALSMRIVGLLLVSAMMVIPVACALQTARSFAGTIYGGIAYGLVIRRQRQMCIRDSGTQLCRDNLRRYCLWARYRFRWSDLILLC